MFHGIYLRPKPKFRWRLITVVHSVELAQRDKNQALLKAKEEGFLDAEAAIQTFDSPYFIPENLPSIKLEDKILLN